MTDSAASPVLLVLNASHRRLRGLLEPLDSAELQAPAYPTEWSIADAASHLGSGAVISGLRFVAGLEGAPSPGNEVFTPIWDEWNGKSPEAQARDAIAADRAFIEQLTAVDDGQRDAWTLEMWGTVADFASFVQLRVSEHVVHTWDIAVAVDPAARLDPHGVELMVDHLGPLTRHTAQPHEPLRIHVATTAPEREFLLDLGGTGDLRGWDGGDADAQLRLSAEALVRLVYGRLANDHKVTFEPLPLEATGVSLDDLTATFVGP